MRIPADVATVLSTMHSVVEWWVTFSTFGDVPVVCPDGEPVDTTVFGSAACRLAPA